MQGVGHGASCETTRRPLNQSSVRGALRVSETMTETTTLSEQRSKRGQPSEDGIVCGFRRACALPRGRERGVVLDSQPFLQRAPSRAATGEQHSDHLGAAVLAAGPSARCRRT